MPRNCVGLSFICELTRSAFSWSLKFDSTKWRIVLVHDVNEGNFEWCILYYHQLSNALYLVNFNGQNLLEYFYRIQTLLLSRLQVFVRDGRCSRFIKMFPSHKKKP